MASQGDRQSAGEPVHSAFQNRPRKSYGVAIALAIVLVGVFVQVAVIVSSGGALSPLQLSLALLALAPLAGAVAALFWLVRYRRRR